MQTFFRKNAIINGVLIVALYIPTLAVFYLAATKEYVPIDEYVSLRFIVLILFMPIILKYILQLCIAPVYSLIERMRSRSYMNTFNPSVTVIIPAWNEEVGVIKTIRSVLNTKYPSLEVIVMNDGSTDQTHKVVTAFIKQYETLPQSEETKLHYRILENGGKARALNAALKIAKGEIIMTIDADSVMDAHAITNIVRHFIDKRVASVAGNVVIGNRKRAIGFIQQLEYMYGFYFKRADSLFNSVYIVGGAAAAYRRQVIDRVGGFDESIITEDIEISTRIQCYGYHVRYAHDSIIYTEGPSDFMGLCQQRLRWKFGRFLTFYKHRNLFFSLKSNHKFYLSFFILPLALFAEMLLFFEGILLAIFFTYTFYTNDYTPLAFVITLLTLVITMQIISDPKFRHHKNLLLLAPVAWLLFYFMDMVEYQALLRSLKKMFLKTELKWQRWNRLGVFEDTADGV